MAGDQIGGIGGVAKGGYVAPDTYVGALKARIDQVLGAGASGKTIDTEGLLALVRDPVIAKDMKRFVTEGMLSDGSGIDFKPDTNHILTYDKAMTAIARRLGEQGGGTEFSKLANAASADPSSSTYNNMRTAFDQAAAEKVVKAELTAGRPPSKLKHDGEILYERLWSEAHAGWGPNDFATLMRPDDQAALKSAISSAITKLVTDLAPAPGATGGATP